MAAEWADVITALVGALTGGSALKLAEAWLTKSKNKTDQDKIFREELRHDAADLRKQIDELRVELRKTEQELDEWREKYWTLFMSHKVFVLEVHSILLVNGIDPKLVLRKDNLLINNEDISQD